MERKDITGVLLLNLGGPDSLDAVRPFLYNLFSDREIIRLGPAFLQKPIAWIISAVRSEKTRSAYGVIGGGSPIRNITDAQARELEDALRPLSDIKVYVGMRYWHPFIRETIGKMYKEGVKRFLALSLYPQYSVATTGSAYAEVKRCMSEYPVECVFADPWYDNPHYIEALFQSVAKAAGERKEIDILYSAHSLPRDFIEKGDPYVKHITATTTMVNEKLTEEGYRVNSYLAYQSRSGPVKWLEPSTDGMIVELSQKGVKELIVVPVSFVSDHIETLYEIDVLYGELAAKNGIILKRVESLNTAPLFIETLKDIVLTNIHLTKGREDT